MSLKAQIQQDLYVAMRAQDERRKAALRMVLSAIQLAETEKGPLDDDAVLLVIQKEIKRREPVLEIMRQNGREDLIPDEEVELEILRSYLPEPFSEEELTALAREVINEVGATSPRDLGQVMKILMPKVRGKAEGRVVNQIVRGLLSA